MSNPVIVAVVAVSGVPFILPTVVAVSVASAHSTVTVCTSGAGVLHVSVTSLLLAIATAVLIVTAAGAVTSGGVLVVTSALVLAVLLPAASACVYHKGIGGSGGESGDGSSRGSNGINGHAAARYAGCGSSPLYGNGRDITTARGGPRQIYMYGICILRLQ